MAHVQPLYLQDSQVRAAEEDKLLTSQVLKDSSSSRSCCSHVVRLAIWSSRHWNLFVSSAGMDSIVRSDSHIYLCLLLDADLQCVL